MILILIAQMRLAVILPKTPANAFLLIRCKHPARAQLMTNSLIALTCASPPLPRKLPMRSPRAIRRRRAQRRTRARPPRRRRRRRIPRARARGRLKLAVGLAAGHLVDGRGRALDLACRPVDGRLPHHGRVVLVHRAQLRVVDLVRRRHLVQLARVEQLVCAGHGRPVRAADAGAGLVVLVFAAAGFGEADGVLGVELLGVAALACLLDASEEEECEEKDGDECDDADDDADYCASWEAGGM